MVLFSEFYQKFMYMLIKEIKTTPNNFAQFPHSINSTRQQQQIKSEDLASNALYYVYFNPRIIQLLALLPRQQYKTRKRRRPGILKHIKISRVVSAKLCKLVNK